MALLAIKYDKGSLKLLDQRLLPFESAWLDVPTAEAAWQHIKDMVVRGAPAIGVTGALAMAVHIISGGNGSQYASVQAAVEDVAKTMDYLVTRCGVVLVSAAARCSVLGGVGRHTQHTPTHTLHSNKTHT